ncbi:MAG: hypothetical protein WCT37_01360 [Patescibacteria group bacterium]
METLKRILTVKNLVILATLVLFLIPFFWFSPGAADLGGDSSRLYFYDPVNFLANVNIFGSSRTVQASLISSFALIPFLVLLVILKFLFFSNFYLLLSVFNGCLLAGSFLGVYLIIRELVSEQDEIYSRLAGLLGGLFYAFSGILVYNWQKYLTSFHSIAVYPLTIWLFIKYLKTTKKVYLFYLLSLSLIFSINFSFSAAPIFFSFFPAVILFLLFYAWGEKKLKLFFKGFLLLLLFIILLQAFHILPAAFNVLSPSSFVNQVIFSEEGKLARGLTYFEGNAPNVKLIYNLIGFPQYTLYKDAGAAPDIVRLIYNYGIKYVGLFFVFPLVVLLSLFIKKDKKANFVFLSLFSIWLIILFFITANLFGQWGPAGYAKLFYLPGFAMFRSFYGVFAYILIFLYALLFGVSLFYLLKAIANRWLKTILLVFIFLAIVYGSLPLVFGLVPNIEHDGAQGVSLAHKIKPAYDEVLEELRQNQLDSAMLSFPLTAGGYQIIEGENGGAYVGVASFPLLAGRTTYAGLADFDYPASALFSRDFILDRLKNQDYRSLNRLFALLNVSLIFNNSSPVVYDGFKDWPYDKGLREYLPTGNDFQLLIDRLGYQKIYQRENYVLYQRPDYFLPHFYLPTAVIKAESRKEFPGIIKQADYNPRTVFYANDIQASDLINYLPLQIENVPSLEFKKISVTKYRLRVHNIKSSFPLVFSEAWHQGWRLYLSNSFNPPTTGNFISANYQGTVQNQNLPNGNLWETWLLPAVGSQYHLAANEYANSWWLDLDYLRKNFPDYLRDNGDGTHDLELIVELAPQRYFYLGVVISSLTLLGLVIVVFVVWWKRWQTK